MRAELREAGVGHNHPHPSRHPATSSGTETVGLRLVEQTRGREDVEQLHLSQGDRLSSPSAVVTFLVWQDEAQGCPGPAQA